MSLFVVVLVSIVLFVFSCLWFKLVGRPDTYERNLDLRPKVNNQDPAGV